MKLKFLATAMLVMTLVPMHAHALTKTATVNVNATIVTPTASINVAGPLSFGTFAAGTSANATTSFTVNVASGVTYSIDLGAGLHPLSTNFNLATLHGQKLTYFLYSDSTKGTKYNAVNPGSAPVIARQTGTGSAKTYGLYAETRTGPTFPAGVYSDRITITVTY